MKTKSRLSILLADDDEDDRLLFREAVNELTSAVELHEVCDGAELMKILGSLNTFPHALFLDLNMPFKNGFECLAEIKKNDAFKSIAIIIYSTAFQQDLADRLYKYGAHYFVRKPDNFEELKRILKQVLSFIGKNGAQQVKENYVIM